MAIYFLIIYFSHLVKYSCMQFILVCRVSMFLFQMIDCEGGNQPHVISFSAVMMLNKLIVILSFLGISIFTSWFWVLFSTITESGCFCMRVIIFLIVSSMFSKYHFNTLLSIPFLAISFRWNLHVYVCVYIHSMVNNIIITKFWLPSGIFWFLNIIAKSCKCLTGKWHFCEQLEVTIFSCHNWSVLLLHGERNYLQQ